MHIFQSPGFADPDVNDETLASWNEQIRFQVEDVEGRAVSPFLVLDPSDIEEGETANSVKWPGNPREPADCLGEELATKLSDWGWPGRAELHNEYLEYTLIMRPDSSGKLRPKRFVATTELKEWWLTMAVFDVDYFLKKVKEVTGKDYLTEDLFNMSIEQWKSMPVSQRASIFQQRIVGFGRTRPPEHPLNAEHALFMSVGINGLDDLIFVVHFGSFPYAVNEGDKRRRARLEEIFLFADRPELFCRNADPGAAQGAYDQVYVEGSSPPQGRSLAFANPLGMYMRAITTTDLRINGAPIPTDWERYSRGGEGMSMRLEFGPSDHDPRFLDEVVIGTGADAPVVTGYYLASAIEVGPLVTVAREARPIAETEFIDIPPADVGDIACGLPGNQRCADIADFADLYEDPMGIVPGTRGRSNG